MNDYIKLKELIKLTSANMQNLVYKHLQNMPDSKYNYIFNLYYESFKSMQLICTAIDIQAYTQIGMLLRSLIEQESTAICLTKSYKLLEEYVKFAKARLLKVTNKMEGEKLENELYNQSNLSEDKKGNIKNYMNFGWLERRGETDISINRVMEIANVKHLTKWRSFCNNFVHSSLSFSQYSKEGVIMYVNEFIYILGLLLDSLMQNYTDITGFNFVFNSVDAKAEVMKLMREINKSRA